MDDCEKVTRQLQHVLEVEGCAYERLEVSSPGLDRPLKRPADYARFAGEQIDLTLKLPFQGRKKYQRMCCRPGPKRGRGLAHRLQRRQDAIRHWIFHSTKCARPGWCRWSISRGAVSRPVQTPAE